MKCIVGNEQCVDGYIMTETGEIICECVHKKAVDKSYHYAEAEPYLKHFFDELEGNPNVKDMTTNKIQKYKEFSDKVVGNLPLLVKDSVKLFLAGVPECGKSQFVNSMVLEAADKHKMMSYYISASDFYDAVFDFDDKTKLQKIFAKAKNPRVEILIIDDMGSEIASNQDKRMDELLRHYNDLIRSFYKKHVSHKGLLMITSNFDPDKFREVYKNDQRLFSMIFQEGSTKYMTITKDALFRQKKIAKSLEALD